MEKDQVKKLIAQNKIEEVFNLLKSLSKEKNRKDIEEELVLLEARFRKHSWDDLRGAINREDLEVEIVKIRTSLLNFTNALFDNKPLSPQIPRIRIKRKHKVRQVLLLGVLGLLIFTLGLIPKRTVSFNLELLTEDLFFRTSVDKNIIESEELYFENVTIESLEQLTGQDIPQIDSSEQYDLSLSGESIQLNQFRLKSGTEIGAQNDTGEFLLFSSNNSIECEFSLTGENSISITPGFFDKLIVQEKGSGVFYIRVRSTEESTFAFLPKNNSKFIISDVQIDTINFLHSSIDDFGKIPSAIDSGYIKIYDSEEIVNSGDFLSLGSLTNTFATIQQGEGRQIRIILEGQARKVRVSRTGRASSLKPTWIRYLAQNEQIMFYGGILLWILIASWFLYANFIKA